MYTEIMLVFSFVPVVIQQNYSVLRAKRKEKISVCRAEACPRGAQERDGKQKSPENAMFSRLFDGGAGGIRISQLSSKSEKRSK